MTPCWRSLNSRVVLANFYAPATEVECLSVAGVRRRHAVQELGCPLVCDGIECLVYAADCAGALALSARVPLATGS